ncbi:MAG: hypothetical protein HRT99_03650 [Mycoplasmatales bacterium]|nr:hypothetical protein [Mycoplasmatales bacterium]
MKNRLITNGIINLIMTILLLTLIAGALFDMSSSLMSNIVKIFGAFSLPSLIMGIVTLAMKRHPSAKGLTIASGILGILSIPFAGAIVSFIGVHKINSSEVEQ